MHDHFSHHHEHAHQRFTHPWPFLKEIEKLGDEYLVRRAPRQFPQTWKNAVVKILPVIVLIVAIISIP